MSRARPNCAEMATVFLDNALHMHRFTIHATRRPKLIPGGIGRPLTNLVTDLIYPGLRDDTKEVLRKLAFSGRDRHQRWALVRREDHALPHAGQRDRRRGDYLPRK